MCQPSLGRPSFQGKVRGLKARGTYSCCWEKQCDTSKLFGEVPSDKRRSLQLRQREYHDSGQALKPVLTSSERPHQLCQPKGLFQKVERATHFPRGSCLSSYSRGEDKPLFTSRNSDSCVSWASGFVTVLLHEDGICTTEKL